ncbi:hypothetical protein BABINDRAFT_159982 [Babjeviella inositovora NRRL Y-12698]|uniref:SH3 domain-containing protein n=1 Tax=Babjeviella inositovora NRRL Y-12698 TaxID=984486 RepID=A0A1E3QVP7_9ASCO|nr:uncharacterized protein BABINDRAFT_159982 [Babjeviella inositovora NRRL Y-12698]ODQ81735.1 hypothetical protein BABINDRAFT_159982 [Babjeviella inositovora NRRL Y-12698]
MSTAKKTLPRLKSVKNLKISTPILNDAAAYSTYTPLDPSGSSAPFQSPTILLARYDFAGENDKELSVLKGDVLQLLSDTQDGWYLVRPVDRVHRPGLVPLSYTSVLSQGARLFPELSSETDILTETEELATNRSSGNSTSGTSTYSSLYSQQHKSATPDTMSQVSVNSPTTLTASLPGGNESVPSLPRIPGPASRSASTLSPASLQNPASIRSQGPPLNLQTNTHRPASHASPVSGPSITAVSISNALTTSNGRNWYRVDVTLSNSNRRYLCRYYQDFYNLHIRLLDISEALPILPEPISKAEISANWEAGLKRCQDLHFYLNKLRLLHNISTSSVLADFLSTGFQPLAPVSPTSVEPGIELRSDRYTCLDNDTINHMLKDHIATPCASPALSAAGSPRIHSAPGFARPRLSAPASPLLSPHSSPHLPFTSTFMSRDASVDTPPSVASYQSQQNSAPSHIHHNVAPTLTSSYSNYTHRTAASRSSASRNSGTRVLHSRSAHTSTDQHNPQQLPGDSHLSLGLLSGSAFNLSDEEISTPPLAFRKKPSADGRSSPSTSIAPPALGFHHSHNRTPSTSPVVENIPQFPSFTAHSSAQSRSTLGLGFQSGLVKVKIYFNKDNALQLSDLESANHTVLRIAKSSSIKVLRNYLKLKLLSNQKYSLYFLDDPPRAEMRALVSDRDFAQALSDRESLNVVVTF